MRTEPQQPHHELEILGTDSPSSFEAAARRAAELLRAGEVVAVPTETVYGLAANAFDPEAVQRVFEVKGRPAHNPIILHVASLDLARKCVREWPANADKLAQAFWPGPLTLVLPKSKDVPGIVTAGGDTVGIRWPSHPFIQALIRSCGFPLAAPSANLSNRLSPTSANHVREQLGGKIRLIVDGGPSHVGIESTVVDVSVAPPRVLRPGMIRQAAIAAVTGKVGARAPGDQSSPRSPGMLKKHYAPRAPLVVWSWRDEEDLLAQIARSGTDPGRVFVVAHTRIPSGSGLGRVSVVPHDAEAFGRALYAELHACDEGEPVMIVVEAVPDGDEWEAIRDRLNRAAHV
jgi:L-threonylcarbamoyladenylate synthase